MDKTRAEKSLAILKKEYPDAKYYLHFSTPLELLVAAILSAQCRDQVVNAVTPALFKKYRTAQGYAKADHEGLVQDIRRIPFAGNKATFIRKACRMIVEKYGGKVPQTMAELTALPGIARKTANVILTNAFGIVEGIPVDTHVIRLSQRLGWSKNKNPEKIEQDVMALFPKKEWKSLPHLLKAHGRAICTAPVPFCSKCPVEKRCPKAGVTAQR